MSHDKHFYTFRKGKKYIARKMTYRYFMFLDISRRLNERAAGRSNRADVPRRSFFQSRDGVEAWFNLRFRTWPLVLSLIWPHSASGDTEWCCMCIHVCSVWSAFPKAFKKSVTSLANVATGRSTHWQPSLSTRGRNKVQATWGIELGLQVRHPNDFWNYCYSVLIINQRVGKCYISR